MEDISLNSFYRGVMNNPEYDWECRKFAELFLHCNPEFKKELTVCAIKIKTNYIKNKKERRYG